MFSLGIMSYTSGILLHHSVILSPNQCSASNIIILHGLLGSSRNFGSFARTLYARLERKHNVVVLDARNHGRSVKVGPLQLEYEAMAQDVLDTMQHLSIHSGHLVGHSMGGKIAATVALMEPAVIKSLAILDIAPVAYTANELSTVTDTVKFLKESSESLLQAQSKVDVKKILESFTPDNNLQAFLLSNLQELSSSSAPLHSYTSSLSSTPSSTSTTTSNIVSTTSASSGFEWKFHVDPLYVGISSILGFTRNNTFSGPTVVIKAGNSDFVKTKHVTSIQKLFPDYRLVSIKNCGHWLHAEKPVETAEIIAQFIEAFDL